jgi:hypothetical protein
MVSPRQRDSQMCVSTSQRGSWQIARWIRQLRRSERQLGFESFSTLTKHLINLLCCFGRPSQPGCAKTLWFRLSKSSATCRICFSVTWEEVVIDSFRHTSP